ncbi:MAG: hypothetical protein II483_01415 [Lachnospiraceae bacterium]|nr:hypothetical protein [Lachnospiraceae bacterium]
MKKDSQINVVVNRSGENDGSIDLMRVLGNMKVKGRVYAWVVILCMVIGVCAPLLLYQIAGDNTRVASVVTFDYDVIDTTNPLITPTPKPVKDLTAPDGTELDVSQITSSFVLQDALRGVTLSEDISISALRKNISIERMLTEDSRRQQEIAKQMLADKNNAAYAQLQSIKLSYVNQIIVSLSNGFSEEEEEEDKNKIYLPDDELRLLLDRILISYNNYLATTYANLMLPGDEISVIDAEHLDIMESVDLLRQALTNLYDYCDSKSDEIKAYRSFRDGRSLEDLMETLQTARDVNVEYLYSDITASSVAKDREAMIAKYRFQMREAQTKLDVVNEQIAQTAETLKNYKHDQIYVEQQDGEGSKTTKITTEYYNKLILEQAANYENATVLEITIDDLKAKIESLQSETAAVDTEKAKVELAAAIKICHEVYTQICDQMEEIYGSSFYTTYANCSAAQGKAPGFLAANMKKMIIGAVLGAFLACGLWFVSAFAAEMKRGGKADANGMADAIGAGNANGAGNVNGAGYAGGAGGLTNGTGTADAPGDGGDAAVTSVSAKSGKEAEV